MRRLGDSATRRRLDSPLGWGLLGVALLGLPGTLRGAGARRLRLQRGPGGRAGLPVRGGRRYQLLRRGRRADQLRRHHGADAERQRGVLRAGAEHPGAVHRPGKVSGLHRDHGRRARHLFPQRRALGGAGIGGHGEPGQRLHPHRPVSGLQPGSRRRARHAGVVCHWPADHPVLPDRLGGPAGRALCDHRRPGPHEGERPAMGRGHGAY